MPRLIVNLSHIRRNAEAVCRLCAGRGISVAGVVKGACGAPSVARAMVQGGCGQMASSRLSQLERLRTALPGVPTLLIRMPLPREAGRVVRACDLSLNTEEATLRALSAAAVSAGVTHGVILMYELGDLREGLPSVEALVSLARTAEALPGIRLAGVGGTLNDLYGVSPSPDNMAALAAAFHRV